MKNFIVKCLTCMILLTIAQEITFAQLTPAQEFRNRMRELLKPQVFQTSSDVQATQAIIRCRAYSPYSIGAERSESIVIVDTSTSGIFETPSVIRLHIPISINGCQSLSVFRQNTDTVFIIQTVLTGLKPATTYFVRLLQSANYFLYDVPQTDGNSYLSDTTYIRFTTASTSPLPRFLSVSSIVANAFTARWVSSDELQASCTFELSADAQFQNILQTRTVQPTDSIRLSGLTPNTRYFYRLRVRSGSALQDIVGENPVQTLSLQNLMATQMPIHTFLQHIPRPYTFPQNLFLFYCSTNSRYYRYRKNLRLSLADTEALLQNLVMRGIAFDTAFVQSNTTCKSDSTGISELVVKLSRENPQMDSLGFALGHTDWAGSSECRQFRTYTQLVPSSVLERSAPTNGEAVIAPNPAKESATMTLRSSIPFSLRLSLHDVLGRELWLLAEGRYGAGTHEVPFSLEGLPVGIYFVRGNMGGKILVRRLAIVR